MGWRQTTTSYGGGITIYYTDNLLIAPIHWRGSGPRARVANFVPAVCSDSFNFGVEPTRCHRRRISADLATGVKSGTVDRRPRRVHPVGDRS